MHRFPVGPLLAKSDGFCDHHERITLPAHFKDYPELTSDNPITFDFDIIKLAHEFTAHVINLHYILPISCSKCLSVFDYEIVVDSVSRQYIYDLPTTEIMPDEEVEHIDKHKMAIDIEPFIKEELLLHFPQFPVCSSGCKGLCATCGANLNTSRCTCSQEENHNPFKKLLD